MKLYIEENSLYSIKRSKENDCANIEEACMKMQVYGGTQQNICSTLNG